MINYMKSFVFLVAFIISINKCLSINHPKRQMRGAWIASVSNIDWPSKPGLTVEQQKSEFIKLINSAKNDNLNALIVQIRPTADSFYPSKLFPWSQWLTGKQGVSPGYDPLEFMIEQTHNSNLEFHAWFNPYRISLQSDIKELSDDNVAKKHPEWVIKYGNLLIFNPGIPEVREYIISGILEVVQNYDIDAIHFDDYFYPYPIKSQEFPDESTFVRYGQNDFKQKSEWRRNNTNVLMEGLHKRINKMKPSVKLGVSPFGVWRNIETDSTGSNTTAGVQCYDDLYADTRKWIKNEWIDYIVPQLYWLIGFKPAAYDVLVEWWDREVNNTDVQLYVGHAVTRVGSNTSSGWMNPKVIEEQMILNTQYKNVKGSVFWNMQHMILNRLNFTDVLRSNLLSKPSLIPKSIKEKNSFNGSVIIIKAIKKETSVELIWRLGTNSSSNITSYFVIYRFDGHIDSTPDISTADNILSLVRYNTTIVDQIFIDRNVSKNNLTYFISPVTRQHIEGVISQSIHIF